jgi:DNA anti-recombination protein RmuC
MKAIQCGFHPNENIVNFCKNESCLLPMCPICIKVHTKEHMNENTHGIYDHISEVYDEIDKSLNNVKNVLKNCHEEVQEVRTMKESRKEATKKKMQ